MIKILVKKKGNFPVSGIKIKKTLAELFVKEGIVSDADANILIVGGVEIADVNYLTLLTAMNYFKPAGSKKNTLFDCIIMAVADRYETDIIFSFDKIYKKQGYRLVSDL